MFLLSLPLWASFVTIVCASTAFSLLAQRFRAGHPSEETREVAEMAASRIGVVHAVALGMMFTRVRVENNEMIFAIESEASARARLDGILELDGGESPRPTRQRLRDTLRFIVDERWPALCEVGVIRCTEGLGGRQILGEIRRNLVDLVEREQSVARVRDLLNEAETYRIQRLFDVGAGCFRSSGSSRCSAI